MLMIGATASTVPSVAYTVLVSIYSYVVVVLVRFCLGLGLLYLRFRDGESWTASAGFKPWGGPLAPLIYSSFFGFLLVASFVPPAAGSPFSKANRGVDWYIVPGVGLASLALAYLYYFGFAYVIPRVRKETLRVRREPVIVKENGEWVQVVELVRFDWVARAGPLGDEGERRTSGVEWRD